MRALPGVAISVRARVGDFPSPIIPADGVDVMTDNIGVPQVSACRLDLRTASRVLAALRGRRGPLTAESGER